MAQRSRKSGSNVSSLSLSLVMLQAVLQETEPKLTKGYWLCVEPLCTRVPGRGSSGRLSTEAAVLPEVSSASPAVAISPCSAGSELMFV